MSPNGPRIPPPAPATRSKATPESTAKGHTKSAHHTKVNDLGEGTAFLEEGGYLIAGEQIRLEQLSIILFQLARAMPQNQKTAVDGIQAIAYVVINWL